MDEVVAAARRVIVDPALPEKELRLLSRTQGPWLPPGDGRPRSEPDRRLRSAAEKSVRDLKNARAEYVSQIAMSMIAAITAALVGSGLTWLSGLFLESFFRWAAVVAYIAVAGSLFWCAVWIFHWWDEIRLPLTVAARSIGHYVCLCDVVEVDGRFLERAVAACDAIMKSAAQREGILDSARNQIEIPQVLWEVAARAQATSRVAVRHEKFKATGNAVVSEVLSRRLAVLKESRVVLEKNVTALEQYATQARTIEQLIALRKEAEQDEAEASAYTHLLASAGTDTGAEAVDAISREAEIAASVLRDVLKSHYDTRDVPRPAE
ncbi:hypothetical protein ACIBRY_32920 [Streptomyces anulatus]